MIIGFDFDKVFINYPPVVPDVFINLFYRRGTMFFLGRKEKKLLYRFPGPIEQRIRILSHTPLLRSPIKKNVEALEKIKGLKKHKTYLVSSRYSFLKKRTEDVLKKHRLPQHFDGIYFNYGNEQPHIFKESMLKKLKINIYVDDDLATLLYLARKNTTTKLYWLCNNNGQTGSSRISAIQCISEITEALR